MATVLEQYKAKQEEFASQIAENSLPMDSLLPMQEVNYRICVICTFQSFCKTAPVTTDKNVMGFHYQLVDAYIRFLQNERKFGSKTDENGQKKRDTAAQTLASVIQDNRKRFASFVPSTPDQYKKSIANMVNTILPVWTQYRNTYVNVELTKVAN